MSIYVPTHILTRTSYNPPPPKARYTVENVKTRHRVSPLPYTILSHIL